MKPFKNARALVEKYFNTTLMYPLQLSENWDLVDLAPLEEDLAEVAKEMLKEKKFFFVSSLLSYGLAGRDESRDHIISAILELKRKGVIVPINIPQE